MIVLQSKVAMLTDRRERLEEELSERMGDNVVILPISVVPASIPVPTQYIGIDVAKQEDKQSYKLMTKKEYIEQRMQVAKYAVETQWEKISKGHNYILTTVKDGSTHYYSLDYFHDTVNPLDTKAKRENLRRMKQYSGKLKLDVVAKNLILLENTQHNG